MDNTAAPPPPVVDTTLSILTTSSVTSITITSAVSGGFISSSGKSSVLSRGICLSLNPDPTIADTKFESGNGIGAFVTNLSGLQPGKSYYLRAFATNNVGTAYGNQFSFSTLPQDSAILLSKADKIQFFYNGDTLPSKIYSPSSDSVLIYYNSQKRISRLLKQTATSKTPVVLIYQGNLITKILGKDPVFSGDPLYTNPLYETSPDMSSVRQYDSLVYQNNRIIAKYHFVAPGIAGINFELRRFEKIYRRASNPELLDRVEQYQDAGTGTWFVIDKIDFIDYDLGQQNPLYKTLKELAYFSDYILPRSIPVAGSFSSITEAYNCLNQYVPKSGYLSWYGVLPQYSLFTFTNNYSSGRLVSAQTFGIQTGKTINYQYSTIYY